MSVKVVAKTTYTVEICHEGKPFAKMNHYAMNKVVVFASPIMLAGAWFSYDEIESYRDLFMQSTPEVIGFVQSQSGLTLAKCQTLLDDWVDIIACAQSIKDKQ